MLKNQHCAVVVSEQTARVADLWREQEGFVPTVRDMIEPPTPGTLPLVDGALGEGWKMRLPGLDIHLLTDAEIFGWHRPEPRRRKTSRRARLPKIELCRFARRRLSWCMSITASGDSPGCAAARLKAMSANIW